MWRNLRESQGPATSPHQLRRKERQAKAAAGAVGGGGDAGRRD
jgi:hypothetical protein